MAKVTTRIAWAPVERSVSDLRFKEKWRIECACVKDMRKVRRHTHGRLGLREIVAEEERRVVSGSARGLQRRAHGGNSRRRMRAESDVSCTETIMLRYQIVVSRRVCRDYDDMLDCCCTAHGWRVWPAEGGWVALTMCKTVPTGLGHSWWRCLYCQRG